MKSEAVHHRVHVGHRSERRLAPGGLRGIEIIDTGVSGIRPGDPTPLVCWKDFVNNRPEPYDDNGQGTHVAGLVVGAHEAPTFDPSAHLLGPRLPHIAWKDFVSGSGTPIDTDGQGTHVASLLVGDQEWRLPAGPGH